MRVRRRVGRELRRATGKRTRAVSHHAPRPQAGKNSEKKVAAVSALAQLSKQGRKEKRAAAEAKEKQAAAAAAAKAEAEAEASNRAVAEYEAALAADQFGGRYESVHRHAEEGQEDFVRPAVPKLAIQPGAHQRRRDVGGRKGGALATHGAGWHGGHSQS